MKDQSSMFMQSQHYFHQKCSNSEVFVTGGVTSDGHWHVLKRLTEFMAWQKWGWGWKKDKIGYCDHKTKVCRNININASAGHHKTKIMGFRVSSVRPIWFPLTLKQRITKAWNVNVKTSTTLSNISKLHKNGWMIWKWILKRQRAWIWFIWTTIVISGGLF